MNRKFIKINCHCNGSRGTDCDWCGGSGRKLVRAGQSYSEIVNKVPRTKTPSLSRLLSPYNNDLA